MSTRVSFHFQGHSFPVVYCCGNEQLSQTFELTLWIEPRTFWSGEIEPAEMMLGQSGQIKRLAADGFYHQQAGIIAKVTTLSVAHRLAITLVPALSLLKGRQHSRVFVDISVRQLLTHLANQAGYSSHQVKWRLSHALPTLAQFVQAMEDDFQLFMGLISRYRLMFWFEASESAGGADTCEVAEVLVISDHNLHSPYLPRGLLRCIPTDGFQRDSQRTFVGFARCEKVHNANKVTGGEVPDLLIKTSGNVIDLFAGGSVTLDDHSASVSGDYLCVSVNHQSAEPGGEAGFDGSLLDYQCKIRFVPRATPYLLPVPPEVNRPTVFPAKIVSSAAITGVDEQGQYRLKYHLDPSGQHHSGQQHSGQASSAALKQLVWYACAGQSQATGWHFPLLNDTDVLVGCFNNDPSQGYLIGAAFTDQQPSMVTAANPWHNRLVTAGQHELCLDDNPRAPRLILKTLNDDHYLELNAQTEGRPFIHWLARLGNIRFVAGKSLLLESEEQDLRMVSKGQHRSDIKQSLHAQTTNGTIRWQSGRDWRVDAQGMKYNADGEGQILAGKQFVCRADTRICLESRQGPIDIRVPEGSVIIQTDKDISIVNKGSGEILIHNQGAEIRFDNQGNIALTGNQNLTIQGDKIIKNGPVNYQVESPGRAADPLLAELTPLTPVEPVDLSSEQEEDELGDIDDSYLVFADDQTDLSEFAEQAYGSSDDMILNHVKETNPHLKRSFGQILPGMPLVISPWSYQHPDEESIVAKARELFEIYHTLGDEERQWFARHHDRLTDMMLVAGSGDVGVHQADSFDGAPVELELSHFIAGAGSVVAGATVKGDKISKELKLFADYSKRISEQTQGLKGQALYSHPAYKEWRARERQFKRGMKQLLSGVGIPSYIKQVQPKAIGRYLNIDKRQIFRAKDFANAASNIDLTPLYKQAMSFSKQLKVGGWMATGLGLYGNVVEIARECQLGGILSAACGRSVVRNTSSMIGNAGTGYLIGLSLIALPVTGGLSIVMVSTAALAWGVAGGDISDHFGEQFESVIFD